jgi:hypothetical protein
VVGKVLSAAGLQLIKCSTEQRPTCQGCVEANIKCRYDMILRWEDDFRDKGLKHGRSKKGSITYAIKPDPSSSRDSNKATRSTVFFVNTTVSDLEDRSIVFCPSRDSSLRQWYSLSPGTVKLQAHDSIFYSILYVPYSTCNHN